MFNYHELYPFIAIPMSEKKFNFVLINITYHYNEFVIWVTIIFNNIIFGYTYKSIEKSC